MKSPRTYPQSFSDTSQRRRRALDVVGSGQPGFVSLPSSRRIRSLSERALSVSKKRAFEGAYREKQAFLKQLQEQSLRDALWRFVRKGQLYGRLVKRTLSRFIPTIAPHKLLYGSLVGGIAFGMVSMAFMEHFFGPGVFARSSGTEQVAGVATVAETSLPEDSVPAEQTRYDSGSDIFFEYFNEAADGEYKENVRNMVKGYPIEEMLPYIFEQDRITAAFLIGIAKKESNWGKRVPVLNDQDCFNYWGYRGVRRMMGTGGHTCFNSRKDAVETVAKRLTTLIHSEKLNTPAKMIVWKCGFSCQGHSRESVKKWISDVDMYFEKLNQE